MKFLHAMTRIGDRLYGFMVGFWTMIEIIVGCTVVYAVLFPQNAHDICVKIGLIKEKPVENTKETEEEGE